MQVQMGKVLAIGKFYCLSFFFCSVFVRGMGEAVGLIFDIRDSRCFLDSGDRSTMFGSFFYVYEWAFLRKKHC